MKKVDRLGWTAGLSVTAYGASVGVRTNDETVLARIPPLLPPAWHPSESPIVDTLFSLRVGPPTTRKGRRNYHLLYAGATRLARTFDMRFSCEVEAQLERPHTHPDSSAGRRQ